eukprot:COSAG05_NODE_13229_length_437_cov_1.668639_1_plen_50_part_10
MCARTAQAGTKLLNVDQVKSVFEKYESKYGDLVPDMRRRMQTWRHAAETA